MEVEGKANWMLARLMLMKNNSTLNEGDLLSYHHYLFKLIDLFERRWKWCFFPRNRFAFCSFLFSLYDRTEMFELLWRSWIVTWKVKLELEENKEMSINLWYEEWNEINQWKSICGEGHGWIMSVGSSANF